MITWDRFLLNPVGPKELQLSELTLRTLPQALVTRLQTWLLILLERRRYPKLSPNLSNNSKTKQLLFPQKTQMAIIEKATMAENVREDRDIFAMNARASFHQKLRLNCFL